MCSGWDGGCLFIGGRNQLLPQFFHSSHIVLEAMHEDVIVICTGNFQKCFIRRRARLKEGFAVGERDNMVVFRMDDEGGLSKCSNFVDVAKSVFFFKPDVSDGNTEKSQQRAGIGETAFNNQAADAVGIMFSQFQH